MELAYIGIGSNLGDRIGNIIESLRLMNNISGITVLRASPIYETEPVDFCQQPNFLNAVVEINTNLTPHELLKELQNIEKRLGRVRTVPKGPRTIDLDILLYDDVLISTHDLTIPHPRMWQRLFVLEPLKELRPDFLLSTGENIQFRCDFLRESQRIRLFMEVKDDIIQM
jgi:2-amino-4-hydroxy-6-hydroxymethyldihydropteridine diphosphokinase